MNRKRISSALIALVVPLVLSCGNMELGSSGDQGSPRQPTNQVNTPGTSQSGSRLKRMYTEWTTDDGLRVIQQDTGIWDDQLKINCSFQVAEDGKYRCLPSENRATIYNPQWFLDANCSKSFVLVEATIKRSYAYSFITVASAGEYQNRYTLFNLATIPETPSALYQKDQNTCSPMDKDVVTKILIGKQTIEVLDKIPPTQFSEGTMTTYQYP